MNELPSLGAKLKRDLALLEIPKQNWVNPIFTENKKKVIDVVIVGAGMCGLAAAFALQKVGITNFKILDSNTAGQEGPWITYARMETLRSPKHLSGPALGVPSLTFQAWFEAQWGRIRWNELEKIPRPMWMDYLIWYRTVLALPVENESHVNKIKPKPYGFDLTVGSVSNIKIIPARHIVLATGREGMARPRVPKALIQFVGPQCYHSSETINFKEFREKEVVIIGFSASALDNAAEALEHGAKKVRIVARSAEIPRINKMKHTNYPGFTYGFPKLSADTRLKLLSYVFRYRVAPPRDSVLRVFRNPNVELILNAELVSVRKKRNNFLLELTNQTIHANQIIYCTGFTINIQTPKELKLFSHQIKTFRDTSTLEGDHYIQELLDLPDLGPCFEFKEKKLGTASFLSTLHNFTFAATATHGNVSGDIPCISEGAIRLAEGIASQIFITDFETHLHELHNYEDPELNGDEITGKQKWKPNI